MIAMTFFGTRFLGSYSSDLHQTWYTASLYDHLGYDMFFFNSTPISFYNVSVAFMGLRKIQSHECARWVHYLRWITFKFGMQLRNDLELKLPKKLGKLLKFYYGTLNFSIVVHTQCVHTFLLDRVHILHTANIWFQMTITEFLKIKIFKFQFVSELRKFCLRYYRGKKSVTYSFIEKPCSVFPNF